MANLYAKRNALLRKRETLYGEVSSLVSSVSYLAYKPTNVELQKAYFIETKIKKRLDDIAKLTDQLKELCQKIYKMEGKNE